MTTTLDTLRLSKDALLKELEKSGATVRGLSITCPFHDDQHPSGSIRQSDDGVWRFKCHAAACGFGGDVYDVRAKSLGKPLAEVLRDATAQRTLPQPQASKPKVYGGLDAAVAAIEKYSEGKVTNRYRYTDPDADNVDLIVLRIEAGGKKHFKPVYEASGGYIAKAPPKPWPLYNHSRIQKAERIVVVEGEKCVHALHAVGIVSTTAAFGAGSAEHTDWTCLAGKTCYLWPDNDVVGVNHMEQIKKLLEQNDPPTVIYSIDQESLNLPKHGDVADFLNDLGNSDAQTKQRAVQAVLDEAEPIGASKGVHSLIEDTISGKRRAIEWPWKQFGDLTKALLPGTLTIICGDPGSTKSFFILEAAAHLHEADVKVAIYELEEDRNYHLMRALAQRACNSNFFDDDWVRANPELVRNAFAQNREFLDSFGRCIYEAPDHQVKLKDLSAWVEDRAQAGNRVIIVDPITAASVGDQNWLEDLRFVIDAKTVVRKYGVSLVLVTHPKKGRKNNVGFDEIAGGAAYQRFVQTIAWIQHHTEKKSVQVSEACGSRPCEINRTVKIIKARNGRGHGANLGFNFLGDSCRSVEQGIIVDEEERK